MRQDVANEIRQLKRKDVMLLNKSKLARRMGCNRRTIDKYGLCFKLFRPISAHRNFLTLFIETMSFSRVFLSQERIRRRTKSLTRWPW